VEKITFLEIVIYAVLFCTSSIIAWEWAKNGFWEIGIQIPLNEKVMGSVFLGMAALFMAGLLEKKGYFVFHLAREENLSAGVALFLGAPMVVFLAARYVILPKGLSEYNRARHRTFFWSRKYYVPGVKKEEGKDLLEFPKAQKALDLFKKAIEIQSKGNRVGEITNELEIDDDQVVWDGTMQSHCPKCGFFIKIPVSAVQGSGLCVTCGCGLGFKVIGSKVYVTAFGLGIRRFTSGNRHNMAVAYEEMAFLLRMMNRFEEAKNSLKMAQDMIDGLLGEKKDKKEYLVTKSLILFRRAEISHTLGNTEEAKYLYQESLNIDKQIGNDKERSLVVRLIGEVS
jgi:tetratricopeptide (TPR) repeat protein